MRRKIALAIVLSLLATLTLTFNIQPVLPLPVVNIGWSHPLTGPVWQTAAVHHLYYHMIIDDYNAKGGLNVGGAGLRYINVTEIDDKYDPDLSIINYNNLIARGMDLLFAPWSTAFNVALLPLYENNTYPVIGLTVGSNTLSELLINGTYTYFFVTLGQPKEDAQELGALIKYINNKTTGDKIETFGVIYRSDEHGIEHSEAIIANLTAMGISKEVEMSYFPYPTPPADFEPFVTALRTADGGNGVDAAILCGYDEGSTFLTECITQDFSPPMLMVGPAMETPFLVYGAFGFTPGEMAGVSYYNGFPATAYATPELRTWARVTHTDYTATHAGFPYLPFPASAVFYAGLQCLFEAVETPGIGLDRVKIRDALATQTFDTLVGNYTFRTGLSPIVENHGTLTQWQGKEMMDVIWPLPASPSALSTDYIIYPRYPWAWSEVPDINRDGKVDMKDIGTAAKAFGSFPGHERWEWTADINEDNKVDMKDIGTIAKDFGKKAAFGGTLPYPE